MLTLILDALFPPRASERLVRDATLKQLSSQLAPQTISLPGGERATALLPYRDPLVNALIVEAKFHKNRRAQKLLGNLLTEYLYDHIAEDAPLRGTLHLIPLPLSKARMKERGENQVERVVEEAVQILGGAVLLTTSVLTRIRETRPQTKLSRHERLENVAGAFGAHNFDPTASYLLIDDVVTTGATLAAAAEALHKGGAKDLRIIALAYSVLK